MVNRCELGAGKSVGFPEFLPYFTATTNTEYEKNLSPNFHPVPCCFGHI